MKRKISFFQKNTFPFLFQFSASRSISSSCWHFCNLFHSHNLSSWYVNAFEIYFSRFAFRNIRNFCIEGKRCFLKALPCVLFTIVKAHWSPFFEIFKEAFDDGPHARCFHKNSSTNAWIAKKICEYIICIFLTPFHCITIICCQIGQMVHIELMVRKKSWNESWCEVVDRDHRCKNLGRDFRDFHMLEMTLEI